MTKNAVYCAVMFHLISVGWAIIHFQTSTNYFDSLYWVATTFTTVGYAPPFIQLLINSTTSVGH